jgi:hypothetical protein
LVPAATLCPFALPTPRALHHAGTLKGFSTGAQGKMYDGCPGCPYRHYSMFYDYYGDFDYADKWVSAALSGTMMTFTSGKHGPNNFHTLGGDARKEAAQKGTAYMNVWMYVVREFEDAIDDCNTCVRTDTENNCNEHSTSTVSVHAWDEGVAFYTGSLEGTAHGGSTAGKLLYRLAEKRCANFGTCGASGTGAVGTSQVNSELSALYSPNPRTLAPSPYTLQPNPKPQPHPHSGEYRALRALRHRAQPAAAGLLPRRAAGDQADRQPDDGAARAGHAPLRVQERRRG